MAEVLWGGEGTSEAWAVLLLQPGRSHTAATLCLSLHHQLQCAAMGVSVAKREKGTLKLLTGLDSREKEDFAVVRGEQRWRQRLLIWLSEGRTMKEKRRLFQRAHTGRRLGK